MSGACGLRVLLKSVVDGYAADHQVCVSSHRTVPGDLRLQDTRPLCFLLPLQQLVFRSYSFVFPRLSHIDRDMKNVPCFSVLLSEPELFYYIPFLYSISSSSARYPSLMQCMSEMQLFQSIFCPKANLHIRLFIAKTVNRFFLINQMIKIFRF